MGASGPVRRWSVRLGALAVAAASATAASAVGAGLPARAEGQIRNAGSPDAVAGSYIVVLKDGFTAAGTAGASARLRDLYGGTVEHVYRATIRGYAARMAERAARRLAADPAVAYVAQTQRVTAFDIQPNPPSWGLDRIDQRNLPVDQTYLFSTTAPDVDAFIIDTGIRASHADFGGRIRQGRDTIDNDDDSTDCNGHGTHVAGTVGGRAHGVAKGVTLWAVRVLNCSGSGTDATVIAGVDWVTEHAVRPAVANMSLGGGVSPTLDQAVQRSIAAGITYAIAAGNSNANACGFSPARTPEAITVGASYVDDGRAGFSNFGPCLDVFAPGVAITSAGIASDTATATFSGTSMAAPHVAGTAALYLATHPDATPQQVRDALVNAATPGKVTGGGPGSPNLLLFTDSGIELPVPSPGCGRKTNPSDIAIPDAGVPIGSLIRVGGCAGNAPRDLRVEVHIRHSFRGDLRIDLVAPDGTEYRLKDSNSGQGGANVDQVFRVNASSETNNGSWVLKVQDRSEGATGFIDSWSVSPRAP